jgi:hypothetical protein
MADPTGLEELTKKCTQSLARYIKEAQRTCSLLDAIKRHPVSDAECRELSAQRTRENLAFVEYHEVRERLFKIAEWESRLN